MWTAASLKHAWGLTPDPHRFDTVEATASHPKLVRAKGLDSDQVFHRHIASPFALGCIALGASLFAMGLCLVHVRGMTTSTIFYAVTLPFGGFGCLISGIWFFPLGSTYGLTLFGMFGGILISISLADLPWANFQDGFLLSATSLLEGAEEIYQALGLAVLVVFVIVVMLSIGSARTSAPVFVALVIVFIGLILYGVGLLHTKNGLEVGCGWLFLICGVLLYYVGVSDLLADEGFPILPLFPLPRIVDEY
ncbi:hypothetical protein RQP46_010156 [Phenoliferia psychrophenolica]